MAFVAVTRLRVRSVRFLLPFGFHAWRSRRQARRARGNLGVRLRRFERSVFWTLTVWQDEAAMADYRITPPHSDAMPKLLGWCDEASVVHWTQDSDELPDWEVAERRMAAEGRLSKVKHPSGDQRAGRLDYFRAGR
jgi:Domain of unknown function (DUF3291)